MRRRTVILLLTISVLAAAAAAQNPRPLDPLTPEEQNRARDAALKDGRMREAIRGDEVSTIVDFIAYKAPGRARGADDAPQGRYADVTIVLPPGRGGIRALVDLSSNAVVDVARVSEASVGLISSDVAAAWALAQRDARVQSAIGGAERARTFSVMREGGARARTAASGNRVEGLRTVGDYPPGCSVHRCIVLLFREGLRHRNVGEVIVNLNTQEVYYEPPRRAGQ